MATYLPQLLLDLNSELSQVNPTASAQEVGQFGKNLSFDWKNLRVRMTPGGDPVIVTDQEALLEDCIKALLTPRFTIPIYPNSYGAEFDELIGLPQAFVVEDAQRIIRETLLVDPRVEAVDHFQFILAPPDGLIVEFRVVDVNGEVVNVPNFRVRYA